MVDAATRSRCVPNPEVETPIKCALRKRVYRRCALMQKRSEGIDHMMSKVKQNLKRHTGTKRGDRRCVKEREYHPRDEFQESDGKEPERGVEVEGLLQRVGRWKL